MSNLSELVTTLYLGTKEGAFPWKETIERGTYRLMLDSVLIRVKKKPFEFVYLIHVRVHASDTAEEFDGCYSDSEMEYLRLLYELVSSRDPGGRAVASALQEAGRVWDIFKKKNEG